MDGERHRIWDAASEEERERHRAAERSREVYRAWNAVCAGTREGDHVTGLRYLPDSNELLVYLDAATWTQEMGMLREIIRARMARLGVDIAGFRFRTSKAGYTPAGKRAARHLPAPATPCPQAPRAALTEAEEEALADAVSPIADRRLAESLKKAMKASLEWKKGCDAANGA